MRIHTPERKNSPRVLKNSEGKIIATFAKDADIVEIKTIEKAFAYQAVTSHYLDPVIEYFEKEESKDFINALVSLLRHKKDWSKGDVFYEVKYRLISLIK